jgi:hypothetical protein
MRHKHYETDNATFGADAYKVRGWGAIAVYVLGWTTEPNEDTEWSGMEARTGFVSVVMIGDDQVHRVDREDLIPISRADYCAECGQIGCQHDGLDREDDGSGDDRDDPLSVDNETAARDSAQLDRMMRTTFVTFGPRKAR